MALPDPTPSTFAAWLLARERPVRKQSLGGGLLLPRAELNRAPTRTAPRTALTRGNRRTQATRDNGH